MDVFQSVVVARLILFLGILNFILILLIFLGFLPPAPIDAALPQGGRAQVLSVVRLWFEATPAP